MIGIPLGIAAGTCGTNCCCCRVAIAAAAADSAASLIMTVLIMLMIVVMMMMVVIMMMLRLILILAGHNAANVLQIAATAARIIQLRSNAQKCERPINRIHNGLEQAAALKLVRRNFAAKVNEYLD